MPRIALGLAYSGALWQGWQTQPGGRTVQDALESALKQFLTHPAPTICAGRTDTGVHALEQVVHLDTPAQRRPESWVRGLNALLPSSITVQWAQPVNDTFHARFSARSRRYAYILRVAKVPSPITQDQVGWVYRPLDLAAMRQAAASLLGEHDFSAFRSSQCQAASPVRTLQGLHIQPWSQGFVFVFQANAFLHHMVRNLMGTLVYIGQGKQAPDWAQFLLTQRDRQLSAPTFSGAGLYLAGVEYPQEYALPSGSVDELLAAHMLPVSGF